MSNHSRYVTRLFDAVSRASGDGVRWVLQVSGNDIVDAPPQLTLTRIMDGRTTHIFGDGLEALGYEPFDRGRILMRKDMIRRRSKVITRPEGDEKRERVMRCIRDYHARLKRTPSHNEIAKAAGIQRKTVTWHLRVLEQLGEIEIVHGADYRIIIKGDKK